MPDDQRSLCVGADLGARPHVSLGSASSRALAIGLAGYLVELSA